MQTLVADHGEVKFIILPTASGLEHKVFVGPFARCFPKAQVFVSPHQWSFPLNLPLSWLGLPWGRTHLLPSDSSNAPFAEEFDYAILGPIHLGLGVFEEVAFFHRLSRTLLLTDALVSVPEDPPAIAQLDPYPLLFHARDHGLDEVVDTAAIRRKGWQRIVLFSFYFRPSALGVIKAEQAMRDALTGGDRSRKNYFGLYPFQWQSDWKQSFEALWGQGRPFVAPILQTLILNRAPQETLDWVMRVAIWDFQRIVACHFDAPILTNPRQFRQAFQFLENPLREDETSVHPLSSSDIDFRLLKAIERRLTQWRVIPPAQD
jgi:hypothetical protein